MGTQIGNTIKNLGKEYNIASSNVGGDKILNSEFLKENTLIIDAKVDNNLYDKGSYSLFITDGNGKAARLTYTIQPGNGLYEDPADTDVVKMYIEGNSIKSQRGTGLYVDTQNIIDNDTIQVYGDDETPNRPNTGRFKVVTANLEKADNTRWGIVRPDENTTYIRDLVEGDDDVNDLRLMVNTQALETVHDGDDWDEETQTGSKQRDGIIKHNSQMFRTIKADNGKLDVLTYNLDKADGTEDKWGVVKGDETTINANAGILSVNTQGLTHATNNSYGTVKVDNKTIISTYGNIHVEAKNLAPATSYDYGVVCFDNWSIGANPDDNKLEVKRFQEIEALLANNPVEHAAIREDIIDLTNRVIKLEIEAFSEKIEFLTPIGDPDTELPQPVFDVDTWSIKNLISEEKTVAFQIKTNCKYKVDVEYKENSNKYNQVTLKTVQVGDSEIIPGNSLAEWVFEETNKTVQTLYFTFDVKNYDADDNIASTNTQVIFTATSINDAAIYQTSFHIFKCWNNKAYELDPPNFETPDQPEVDLNEYFIVNGSTETIEMYTSDNDDQDYSDKTEIVELGQTSSKNFYFNSLVNVSNYDAHNTIPEGNNNSGSSTYVLKQSINSDNKQSITGDKIRIVNSNPDDFKVSIIGSYNSTKLYNVLKVESTKPLSKKSRSTQITISVPDIYGTDDPDYQIPNSQASAIAIKQGDNIDDKYTYLLEAINDNTEGTTFDTLNTHNISKVLTNDKDVNQFVIYDQTGTGVYYADDYDNGDGDRVNGHGLWNIVYSDLEKLNAEYTNLLSFASENNIYSKNHKSGRKAAYITDKTTYLSYWTYINNINNYINAIKTRINIARDVNSTVVSSMQDSIKKNEITFKYTENVHHIYPIINLDFNVATNGLSYVITRNAGSLYETDGYLSINYIFTNKNGDNVDATGKQFNGDNYYNFTLPISANNYLTKGKYAPDFFNSAASGYTDSTKTVTSYFNVVVMEGWTEDRYSGWPNKNRDIGYCSWAGYLSESKSAMQSIPDDIYMLYRCKGLDAGTNNYFSTSWKGSPSGDYHYLVRSNWLCWEGLLNYECWKTDSVTVLDNVKIGNNYYMTKNYAISQLNAKNVSTDGLTLYQLAKKYYETFNSKLVYKTDIVPIKVANNITGMKIVSINTDNALDYDKSAPAVIYNISGLWTGTNDTSNDKPYTFGDAYISAINIDSWDDFEITIKFIISGGKGTNIPDGTQFSELTQSNNGSTKFIFLNGSKSYNDTYYYDSKSVTYSVWKDNKCTVTYKLYNDYNLDKTNIYQYKSTTMYDKNTKSRKTVYLKNKTAAHVGDDNFLVRLASNLAPDLLAISGIKVWFGLQSNSLSLSLNFESSTSSNGVEIKFDSTTFLGTVNKNLNIVNAIYDSTLSVTSTPSANNFEKKEGFTITTDSVITISKDKTKTLVTGNKIIALK